MSNERWSLEKVNNNPGILTSNSPFVILPGCAQTWYNGRIFNTAEGYQVRVINYIDKHNVVIEFTDRPGEYYTILLSHLRSGSIKNPYKPNRFGGVFGNGPYTKNQHKKLYYAWSNMLQRLTEEFQNTSRNKAYKTVSICPEWMNYQNFAYWYDSYLNMLNPDFYNMYQLDKDIMQWGNPNKVYSPVGCCVVPEEVNLLFSNLQREREVEPDLPLAVHKSTYGNRYNVNLSATHNIKITNTFATPEEAFKAYKEAKTMIIHQVADKYYSVGAITKEVYEQLYRIDIQPFNNHY